MSIPATRKTSKLTYNGIPIVPDRPIVPMVSYDAAGLKPLATVQEVEPCHICERTDVAGIVVKCVGLHLRGSFVLCMDCVIQIAALSTLTRVKYADTYPKAKDHGRQAPQPNPHPLPTPDQSGNPEERSRTGSGTEASLGLEKEKAGTETDHRLHKEGGQPR